MIAWFTALALASPPTDDAPAAKSNEAPPAWEPAPELLTAVRGVRWAQAFTVAEPDAYALRADRPPVTAGWILQLDVTPGALQARAIDAPVLYADAWPARVLGQGGRAGCVVVWAPLDRPPSESPLFLGPTTLPERVDRHTAEAIRDRAVALGAPRFTPAEVAPPLDAATLDGVWSAATARAMGCPD